jgi:protein-tyrosine phosphatase
MQRLLPLQGGRNFRDLGGYPTEDGRRVRHRLIYRSGVMAYLTEDDQRQLDSLGIRVLCDFRHARERTREVIGWAREDLRHVHWDYDPEALSLRRLLGGESQLSADVAYGAMIRLYQSLPELFREPYAQLFARIAAGEVPLVFGCTAGKDRTGLAAALLLTSLQVPWSHVVADFELTDTLVDLERVLLERHQSMGLEEHEHLRIANLPKEVRAPLLAAKPAYLEAAFQSIGERYGSFGGYLGSALQVSAEDLQKIRELLLE